MNDSGLGDSLIVSVFRIVLLDDGEFLRLYLKY